MRDIFATIQYLFEEDKRDQFPYADCRKMQAKAGKDTGDLTSDLAAYFADLAGYCSRGSRIAQMPLEEFLKMKKAAEKSFFDKHPLYEGIKKLITESDTPDLFKGLGRSERMRAALLRIVELHLTDRSLH